MLLKVDIYPSVTGEAYTGTTREPDETVYVCLATAAATGSSKTDAGRLLTVGRKTGDIMLTKDKSVSREHCIIRMVTTNKTLPKGKASPLPARTPDEIKACQESSFYQCSIVLENVGRLGTFLLEQINNDNNNKKPAASNNGDDSDTDEEADMMVSQPGVSASQASQLPISTWVRNLVTGTNDESDSSTTPIRTRLINNSTILSQLDADDGRVVVLCGKQESILVLTRIPIYVQRTRTSFSKSNVPSWWSELYAAGAVDVSENLPAGSIMDPKTTHLISSTRSSSHKQLCAWLKGIQMIKAEYIEAILERKSPRDAFPDSASFAPPRSPGQNFWDTRPIPNVWQGLTYISMKREDEWPDVVRAMGGDVCLIYEEISSKTGDNPDNEGDEDKISEEILSKFDPSSTWSVEIKGRRYTQPLKKAGIPIFNAKDVARAVTNSKLLPGLTPRKSGNVAWETQSTKTRQAAKSTSTTANTQANTPGDARTPDPAKTETTEKESPEPKPESSEPAKSLPQKSPDREQVTMKTMTRSATRSARRATRSLPSSDSESDEEPIRRRDRSFRSQRMTQKSTDDTKSQKDVNTSHSRKDTQSVEAKKHNSRRIPSSDSDSDSEPIRRRDRSFRSQRSTQKSSGDSKSQKDLNTSRAQRETTQVNFGDKDNEMKENDSPAKEETDEFEKTGDGDNKEEAEDLPKTKTASESNKREKTQTEQEAESERPSKRVKLGTSSSGWLQAAPAGKKRQMHARTKEEMLKAYGGDTDSLYTKSADTEWAPKPTIKAHEITAQPVSSRRRRDTGPNFKAFRKNRVPPVQTIHYQWTSHRSVPAVQQAQLEEEQREADEQFRRANELFKDPVRPTAVGRRRKLQ